MSREHGKSPAAFFWKKLHLVIPCTYAGCVTSKHPALVVETRSPWAWQAGKGIFISGVRKGLDASRCLTSAVPLYSEFLGREKHTQVL